MSETPEVESGMATGNDDPVEPRVDDVPLDAQDYRLLDALRRPSRRPEPEVDQDASPSRREPQPSAVDELTPVFTEPKQP